MKNSLKFILRSAILPSLFFMCACTNSTDVSNNDSEMTESDKARLAECHQILEEYNGYWTPAPEYTEAQRDSMLLTVGPDSLRALITMLVNGELNQQ